MAARRPITAVVGVPEEGIFTEEQKRLIRESLAYALHVDVLSPTEARNVIADFYASLNRKLALTPREAEEETKRATEVFERLRGREGKVCPYCGAVVPEWLYGAHVAVCKLRRAAEEFIREVTGGGR